MRVVAVTDTSFFPWKAAAALPRSRARCDLPFPRQLFVCEIPASGGWQTAGELPNWVNEGIGTFGGFYCLKLIKNLNLDNFRLFIPYRGLKSLTEHSNA